MKPTRLSRASSERSWTISQNVTATTEPHPTNNPRRYGYDAHPVSAKSTPVVCLLDDVPRPHTVHHEHACVIFRLTTEVGEAETREINAGGIRRHG